MLDDRDFPNKVQSWGVGRGQLVKLLAPPTSYNLDGLLSGIILSTLASFIIPNENFLFKNVYSDRNVASIFQKSGFENLNQVICKSCYIVSHIFALNLFTLMNCLTIAWFIDPTQLIFCRQALMYLGMGLTFLGPNSSCLFRRLSSRPSISIRP